MLEEDFLAAIAGRGAAEHPGHLQVDDAFMRALLLGDPLVSFQAH